MSFFRSRASSNPVSDASVPNASIFPVHPNPSSSSIPISDSSSKVQTIENSAPEINNDTTNTKGGFKQYSDEELEKFTKFVKEEKIVESDEKVVYLQSRLLEIKNSMSELRKQEKNTIIPELEIRVVSSKIDFYALSHKQEDFDKVIHIFDEVNKELKDCASQRSVNVAEELMKDLELERIKLKR